MKHSGRGGGPKVRACHDRDPRNVQPSNPPPTLTVRIAHWVNELCLTVLLMSVLQVFNAHPALYIGKQSDFDHPILSITAEERNARLVGVTNLAGTSFTTTGILMPTPAFPHDHVMPYSARHIEIEGKEYPVFRPIGVAGNCYDARPPGDGGADWWFRNRIADRRSDRRALS